MLLLIAAFAAYPVTALIRRLRGRSRTALPAAPRVLSAAGLVAVLGSFAFLFYLLMTGGKPAPGRLRTDRPGVAAGRDDERAGASRLLLAGGAVFLPWSLYWGLLLP
ncbi:hypothetical protein ACQP2K_04605 [Microbispora siamensis]